MRLLRLVVIGVSVAVIARIACALAGLSWVYAFPISCVAAWLFLVWVDRPRDRQESSET